MPGRLLRVPEVRERLGRASQETVYKLIRSGELPSVKLGRSRRIRESDLEQFIASLSVDRPGDAAGPPSRSRVGQGVACRLRRAREDRVLGGARPVGQPGYRG